MLARCQRSSLDLEIVGGLLAAVSDYFVIDVLGFIDRA
jgi:hypothetical protein